MTYQSPYGETDGLERRLAYWANQLSRDKSFPWVGTGLVVDLNAAARRLGADPDAMFPPPPPAAPAAPAPSLEYGL